MQFDESHYTRDWDLLAGVADEWKALRQLFQLGSKATRQQIEEHWDAIFKADPAKWPHIRRAHYELMRDEPLVRHLRKCYWKELKPWERKGYNFEEVLSVVLMRIFWQVVRNAHKWLQFKGKLEHWARFWNTDSLAEELRRAIDDREESERSQGMQLRPCDEGQDHATQDPEMDYQGRRPERPERALEHVEEDQDVARAIREHCSDADARLLADWLHAVREFTEEERKRLKTIAQRLAQKRNLGMQ